ncbi:filamentous hemagglutinin N-terminal domain-containing protein [Nostoc sp. ChiQUE01b]|uniref:two-partner secretion domain-containing protein n=1 Tax=Nostoc sp. ChiQUE01b TaxID=3075376 RepID=UPI002AD4BD38|nr:filamentous hemagglutinin N-terminal domain-containing protein [Nostoc sp. ChiQUE01b]MDZ8263762.1 filamentous hemagglutinin N-terminal domain-containing protein [Nostoc sp. ChiQUE01b]
MVKTLWFAITGWLGCVAGIAVSTHPAFAQLTPDNSLGKERSQVIRLNPNNDHIEGGAARGANLFHSFQDFNVGVGQGVYFANPEGITNIFSRVTGGNSSNIFGKLGVSGGANLFLLNPNGILFGKNASLDVQGSFVGTTANGIQFGNQGVFSATNPEAAPLLTINPSALLFNQIQGNAGITNQSQADAGKNLIAEDVTGLRVADGKSLLLVGGNINIDGGSIRTYEGNIELAGLAAPGNVGLNIAGDNISLAVPDSVERANVSLNNAAEVNVRGANGGNIKIHARDVNLAGESKLRAGRDIGLGTSNSQGGNIEINATGTINLTNASFISNTLRKDAVGKSGDINITTGSLNLSNDSFLDASTFGQGNSGKVSIVAKDNIALTDSSDIYSSAEEGSVGNGGSINIQTGSLSLAQGSELNTQTLGQGNAGSININARDAISLDGFVDTTVKGGEPGRIYSRIISNVNPEGTGKAGDIQIKTGSLQSTNGAFISSSTLGKGDAGNITIDANDITFDSSSNISSQVFADGVGKGGNIRVNTGALSLLGGSQISTTVSGKGDAGNIFVNARDTIKLDGIVGNSISGIKSGVITGGVGNGGNIEITTGGLSLTNGAKIDIDTHGKGNAGNITINARETINIDGCSRVFTEQCGEDKLPSEISSDVSLNGVGKGGDIRINTRELFLKNNGQISADTLGLGDGGNIFIQAAEKISLSNTNNIDFTKISSTVVDKAKGNAGTINIQARDLSLDNAAINSYTYGQGNGGDIDIQTGKLSLNNGQISADTLGLGDGGNIFIQAAEKISLSNTNNIDFTKISSTVVDKAKGNAGTINIQARDLSLDNAAINSYTYGQGNGGDIDIQTGKLSLNNGSYFFASTFGKGNAGNISIQATDTVSLANSSNISSAISITGVGNAGNIDIFAKSFSLDNDAGLVTLSFGKGNAGNVLITTLGDTTIKDSTIATFFIATEGNAGKIAIQAGGDVSISGKSALSSFLHLNAVGKSGDIEIQGRNFSLSDGAVLNSTTAGKGNAGNVLINATGDIYFTNGANINAATFGQGNAGNVIVNAGGKFSLQGTTPNGFNFDTGISSIVAIEPGFTGKGKGGNINVTARDLSLNGAALAAGSLGDGIAGNININSSGVRLDNKAAIGAETNSGDGGNINLTATDLLLLRRNSNISTTAGLAKSGGDGGNINIDSKFIGASREENSDISANAYTGSGGRVQINSQGIFGIEARTKPTEKSDITASSELGVSGTTNINAPDTSYILNSFTGLLPNVIDTNALIANSCISRSSKQEGTFFITGSGALRNSPGDRLISIYSTGEVRNVEPTSQTWKKGDAIVEPQGLYRLADGRLILSRECH